MNEYARDLFSISTYINHLQIILSRYSTKSVGLKIVLFPLFLLCLIFLIVAITPVFALGLLVKLFFEILIDDLIDKNDNLFGSELQEVKQKSIEQNNQLDRKSVV